MSNNKKVLIIGFSSIILLIIFFAAIRLCFDFYIKAGPHRKSTRDVNTTDYSYATGCRIGEPWVVDGQWSLTILGVREVDYSYLKENTRDNLYKEEHLAVEDYYPDGKNPDVIYIMDYAYTNLGYENEYSCLLISDEGFDITDTAGVKGYKINSVPGVYVPEAIPIGATCMAQACIGLDYDGPFRIVMHVKDKDRQYHTGQFIVDPKTPRAEYVYPEIPQDPKIPQESSESNALEMGETWVVDGQWEVTVTGVKQVELTSINNPYFNPNEYRNPAAVYSIEYTYKSTGFELGGYMQIGFAGQTMTGDEYTIVDNAGVLGYTYPVGFETPPLIKKGESADFAQSVGVENPGDFTVTLRKCDTNQEWHEQTFKIDVPEN